MQEATRQALLDMKQHLARGWTQGELQNKDGVCLFGALVQAWPDGLRTCVGPGTVTGREGGAASGAVGIAGGSAFQAMQLLAVAAGVGDIDQLAVWNDQPQRTHEQVIDLIDQVLAQHPAAAEEHATA